MTYEKTVAAAVAETKSKFALAEALAEDIPPRHGGPTEDVTINEYLTEARQAIVAAGGEGRSVGTLRHYRDTALWVRHVNVADYRWLPGVSFTAHTEARLAGLTHDEFVAMPSKKVRDIRPLAGTVSPDGDVVRSWSLEQKAEAARELLADPEVAEQVEQEITDYVASDHKRTADVVSKRRKSEKRPESTEEAEQRPARDYDALTEQHVNGLSVVLAAESSSKWTPSERSEALLYFLEQILGNRREPTGDQADFVNEKLEGLFSEVEAYANAEVS